MEAIPEYNRDVVVRCVTRLYETLVKMGYMEDLNILRAPFGGWDDTQIDAKSLRIMDRTETVIDLLRHLPYLEKVYEIMPDTKPIKYLGRRWDDTLAETFAQHNSLVMLLSMPFESLPEPGMICLTDGSDSEALLIDTQTGKMYPFGDGATWNMEVAETGQREPPWLWYTPVSIEKYFDELHRKFTSLELIPLPRVEGVPDEAEHRVYNSGQREIIVSSGIHVTKRVRN